MGEEEDEEKTRKKSHCQNDNVTTYSDMAVERHIYFSVVHFFFSRLVVVVAFVTFCLFVCSTCVAATAHTTFLARLLIIYINQNECSVRLSK